MRTYYKEYAYTKMPFGKYRGVYLKDVPREYIEWAVLNVRDLGTAEMFKIELLRRAPSLRKTTAAKQ